MSSLIGLWMLPLVVGGVGDEGELLFERHVLPTLQESCLDCHGPGLPFPEGGFRIADRATLLAGGDSGTAIVPGKPEESELIVALRYVDPFLEMPPGGKLPDDEIAAFERWIELGAPWPEGVDIHAEAGEAETHQRAPDVESGADWWSYRPVLLPDVPPVDPERASTPIDAFLVARLDEAGIERNPRADKRELVRRAYHTLHGLPPTADDIAAFVDDDSPDAWERLVDRLLDSPRYAERWGRHWLDLVRYAQTNGYERDGEKPFAWRYRDWVIDALDRDMPYDEFLTYQLAGDEVDGAGAEGLIATGFYRIVPWDDEPDDKETAVYDELDDIVRTISEGMLGMTVACARCHDHKFDPIPQKDYYSLLSYVRGVRPYADPEFTPTSPTLALLDRDGDALERREAQRAKLVGELQAELDAIQERGRQRLIDEHGPKTDLSDVTVARSLEREERERVQDLRTELREAEGASYQGSEDWILCVREMDEPPPTHLLVRGKASAKGDLVEPSPPSVLLVTGDGPPRSFPDIAPTANGTSGRRLALARWIASPDNPLTPRALVNRVWQMHFGRGIAPTVNDFGRAGMPPTHPELLDYLASTFVYEDAWSLKALHRRLLLTDAFQASSRATNEAGLAADEANDLLWRQRPQRMTAEEVHDAALLVSGELRTDERGGRGFFPRLSREVLAGASRPGLGWELSTEEERARRAVYAFVKRGQPVPLFDAFDAPNLGLPVGTRSVTTTPTQALATLNGAFFNARARALAIRVLREADADASDGELVAVAYRLVLGREPTGPELAAATEYLGATRTEFQGDEDARAALVVQPDVPARVDAAYLDQLGGEDVLFGPRDGWAATRGLWTNPYNGTLGADEMRGPAMLHEATMRDFRVRAEVTLPGESAVGVLLRSSLLPNGEVTGIEVRLDVEAREVIVLSHGPKGSKERARATAELAAEVPTSVEVRLIERKLGVKVAGDAVLTVDDLGVTEGALGLRAFGEGAAFTDLVVVDAVSGASHQLQADAPPPEGERALEALCLTLLNLNEFLYID